MITDFRVEPVPADDYPKGSLLTHQVVCDGLVVGRFTEKEALLIAAQANNCGGCERRLFGNYPSHDGSALCELRHSIRSGGTYSHCFCSQCYGVQE